jgi:hypothetical protein
VHRPNNSIKEIDKNSSGSNQFTEHERRVIAMPHRAPRSSQKKKEKEALLNNNKASARAFARESTARSVN